MAGRNDVPMDVDDDTILAPTNTPGAADLIHGGVNFHVILDYYVQKRQRVIENITK